MKTIFLVLGFLIASTASANSLDNLVSKLNNDLNPKNNGEKGYQIDYVQGNNYVWLNVIGVEKICQDHTDTYIKNHRLVKINTFYCDTHGSGKFSLFQITCKHHKNSSCMNALANQVNSDVIKDQIKAGIEDVLVEP